MVASSTNFMDAMVYRTKEKALPRATGLSG